MWMKVRVSSLSLFRLHGSGKLVKSGGRKIDNLSKTSIKVCSYSLNSSKFYLLAIVLLKEKKQFKFEVALIL